MGLFKKKKEQTDTAQGNKNRFVGFVLLLMQIGISKN